MEGRELPWVHNKWKLQTTQIMVAAVCYVGSGVGLTKISAHFKIIYVAVEYPKDILDLHKWFWQLQ